MFVDLQICNAVQNFVIIVSFKKKFTNQIRLFVGSDKTEYSNVF